MLKTTATLLLGMGLMLPLVAQPQRDDDHHDHDRYYDRDHRDYHEWNEKEDRAWHRYWEERRHAAIEWQRANEEQRREYWRWRHEHPDSLLWPDRR